jgi:hypothetical protein
MARVEWSRLSGEEVEAVLAIMLCREYPSAIRIKPSVGDGGIDLRVSRDDGIIVFQIKGYTGRLTATRKKHITKSLKKVKEYAEANSLTLSEWILVMPENPSKEAIKWFDEVLTVDTDFSRSWKGLDYVDGLAAKYQDIIDYYLRDGKDRLEVTVKEFLAVVGLENTDITPSGSVESIENLHDRLNKFDPHYRYDFSVAALGPDGSPPPVQMVPGLVAAVRVGTGERFITYKIIARFHEAVNERPIPGSMKMVAEAGSDLERQINDWVEFGTPLKNVPVKDVNWDLPGGFGGALGDAVVSIGPSIPQTNSGTQVTVRILEPDGDVVSSLDFVNEEVSAGLQRQGLRSVGRDMASGLVRLEMRMAAGEQPKGTVNLAVESYVGRSPADMLPSIQFLSEIKPPRRLQLFLRNGPALAPPWDIPQALLPEGLGRLWRTMCQSLATIQENVIERIGFPNIDQITPTEANDAIEAWHRAARILRGEEVGGTWTEVEMHLHPGQTGIPAGQLQGLFVAEYSVRIGSKVYSLGTITMHTATLRQDETRPPVAHGDHIDIWVVPDGDDTATIRRSTGDLGLEPPSLPSSS